MKMEIHGGIVMDKKIIWNSSMVEALKKTQAEKKTVLVDFFNPG